ncbi:hypothetical protein ACFYSC_05070 [Streptosporangium sp. NPDC004379]|uniref:hypothetical protein n=1 Tax=Streptosporangium sp. NPDC004379 TaxID=3366189 RepID=UPI0036B465EB
MTAALEPPAATGAGGSSLERRYRRLLLCYPRRYRAEHGGEIIATLLETAEPGRALPPLREARALVSGGLRARIVAAADRPAWLDGLHLGVTALCAVQLATLVPYAASVPIWASLSALALLLVLRGRVRLALPVVALVAAKVCAITLGHPWLDPTLLPVDAPPAWHAGALYGGGGPVAPMVGYGLTFLGLLVLTPHRGRLGRRSWLWLPAVPLLAGADPAGLDFGRGGDALDMVRTGLELALLLFAARAGHVARDPRWAVAAGVHLVAVCAVYAENLGVHSEPDLAHLAVVLLATALAAAVPYRARRHPAL